MNADDCYRDFIADDFLENPGDCGYEVVLSYPFQVAPCIPPTRANRDLLGYTVVYQVKDPATNNSCWGYVTIEDKTGPLVPCKSTTISCFQLAAINQVTAEAKDNCSDVSNVISNITWKDYGCDSVGILGLAIRNIQTSDAWGNGNTCTDTLTIRKNVLDSVCCASMINLPCRMYCLNGTKLFATGGNLNPSSILNVKYWDLVTFSKDPKSPNYPSPEFLLKLQGKGDPMVELGAFPARWGGTKVLFDNLILPNQVFGSNENFCINPDSLVVPYLSDSVLDLQKTLVQIELNDEGFEIVKKPNEAFCTIIKDKTPMYPQLGGVCKIIVSYVDKPLDICGAGFKIRREWRIYDWCTGEEKICVQYITIEDKVDPSIVVAGSQNVPGPITQIVTGLKDTVGYLRSVGPHDCYANFNINRMNVWDCSDVKQSYTFVYADPGHPGKTVVLTKDLGPTGAPISLPVGIHIGKMSLTDACYNTCNFPLVVFVEDMTPPTPNCIETTQVTVDPATCWARVYAKDLNTSSKDNCCDNLHYAVADMDSVDYYRKAYTDHLKLICGWANYEKMKTSFEFIVEEYLSTYVFKDYVDLTECGERQVVLRVFDNCKTALYDPHITKLTEHKWYMAQIYGYYFTFYHVFDPNSLLLKQLEKVLAPEAYAQLDSFKVHNKTEADCQRLVTLKVLSVFRQFVRQFVPGFLPLNPSNPNLTVIIDLIEGIQEEGIGSFCIPEFKISIPFEGDAIQTYLEQHVGEDITAAVAATGFVPFALALCKSIYNDCMINILVDDKTPPVCETPEDIFWYCDGVSSKKDRDYEYARAACDDTGYTYDDDKDNALDFTCRDFYGKPYNNIECKKENDSDLSDTLDGTGVKSFGWYGCSIYGPVHQDEHGGEIDPCVSRDYGSGRVPNSTESNRKDLNSWSPIYCHTWLCLDKTDQAGKLNPKDYFSKPILLSGGPNGTPLAGYEKGDFKIWDNCWIGGAPTVVDQEYIDNCGNGWISRTWTVGDKCMTSSVSCTQKIIMKHRSDFEVMFPEDVVAVCGGGTALDPDATGRPMIMDDDCELVGVQYDDERFDIVPDACYKIIRTWKLIDWCKYDPNAHDHDPDVIVDDRFVASADRYCVYRKLKDDGDGFVTYTQIIKVIDTIAPEVTCRDTTFCFYDGYTGAGAEPDPMCSVPVYIGPDFVATDNCTETSLISFRYEVNLNASTSDYDGKKYNVTSIDFKSGPNQKRFTSAAFPSTLKLTAGKHLLTIIAEDNCGKEDTTTCKIEVKDCKKPTPYCYNGIATVIMPSTGSIIVWAKDLDAGSYDNCTKKADLKFSFDADGKMLSDTFTCKDIPNGIAAINEVDIYVTDATGNVDFCHTILNIQDGSGNICGGASDLLADVSGKIMTETSEPVEQVTLDTRGGQTVPSFKTSSSGTYAFDNLPMYGAYSIIPVRTDHPTNGVSTIDLILIQKHIIGEQVITSPYHLIAADADKSGDISAVDLIELRKLILTIYDKLPNTDSWRFVPKDYIFTNPANPWNFPEKIDLSTLSKDEVNRDFIGIKVGDLNSSVVPHSLLG
ncbi:MAG: hypothetical protein WBP00_06320, partial [Saprospiraceae bacterium]